MKIAFLTSGGIAPCLSASIGRLTENYLKNYPNTEIIGPVILFELEKANGTDIIIVIKLIEIIVPIKINTI